MVYRWILAVAAVVGCGPAVDTPVESGTDSASSGADDSPGTTNAPTASVTGTVETSDVDTDSVETGNVWPMCVPETVNLSFTVGELIEFESGEVTATCDVDSIQGGSELTLLLDSCVDEDGDPTGGLHLVIYGETPPTLDFLVGQQVEVSFVLVVGSKEEYQLWYSLRDPKGRLHLAAFSTFDDHIEPLVDDAPVTGWFDPFSLELGEFVCPPEADGCEDDDNPQRALATLSDGVSTTVVVDGTVGRIGEYTLLLAKAREPDYCEGRPTSPKLGGILYRDP